VSFFQKAANIISFLIRTERALREERKAAWVIPDGAS
jgi:hypothetical protein